MDRRCRLGAALTAGHLYDGWFWSDDPTPRRADAPLTLAQRQQFARWRALYDGMPTWVADLLAAVCS